MNRLRLTIFNKLVNRCILLSLLSLIGMWSAVSKAQTAPIRPIETEHNAANEHSASSLSTVTQRELGDTVTILPWSYKSGKDSAIEYAREVSNQLLLETGFNVFLPRSSTGAMPPAVSGTTAGKHPESPFDHLLNSGKALLGQEVNNKSNSPFVLPTLEQMTAIGEKAGTHYVLAGRVQWKSRYVWVGIANRTKAICTIDLLMLDMNSHHFVLEAHDIVGDSTEQKNPFSTALSVATLNPMGLVMPGSVIPQQQHAVAIAISKAIAPWLKPERIKMALSQADESSEAAGGGSAKFSTFVSQVSDLEANLGVVEQTPKQVEALDKDMHDLFSLHTVKLQYKEINKLRLSATSSQAGPESLIVNEETRTFIVPDHKTVREQDVSSAPERKLSLLDFCGILTKGIFEYMRARYVRQEKMNGVDSVVYDLTYWGIDEGPYHRIWIDPKSHAVIRNEWHDRQGKLKAVYLYRQPHELASQTWAPTSVDIEDADQKTIASIKIKDVHIDQNIPNDVFTVNAVAKSRPKLMP